MSIQPTAGQTFSTPRESRAVPSLWIHCTITSTTWRAVDKLGVMELPSAAKDLAGPVWPWSTASRNGRDWYPTKRRDRSLRSCGDQNQGGRAGIERALIAFGRRSLSGVCSRTNRSRARTHKIRTGRQPPIGDALRTHVGHPAKSETCQPRLPHAPKFRCPVSILSGPRCYAESWRVG